MITIIALCTSFLSMYNSGVYLSYQRYSGRHGTTQGTLVDSGYLMGRGNESIDYYENGDDMTMYNVSLDSYYNDFLPEQNTYNQYLYHHLTELETDVESAIDYVVRLDSSFDDSGIPFGSGLTLGSFRTDYSGSPTKKWVSFTFTEDSQRVACNLVLDIKFIWMPNLATPPLIYSMNVPFYTSYGASESNSSRNVTFYLTDEFTTKYSDSIFVDFGIRLAGINEVTSYYQTLGYNQGYQIGYGVGYTNGVNIGSQSSEDSFRGLLGVLIDSPILFLRKFFGYNVFGVDLYAALATMISLIVALSIFRLVRSII